MMFDKFKELGRASFSPIHLCRGDSLRLTFNHDGVDDVLVKTILCEEQEMVIDEGVLFEAEFEGRRVLGGFVLEKE